MDLLVHSLLQHLVTASLMYLMFLIMSTEYFLLLMYFPDDLAHIPEDPQQLV